MPFTVQDFQDLVRVLEQQPEWRSALRRQVLTDELLSLPELVRQLAEAEARSEQGLALVGQRLAELAEAQARTEQRLALVGQRLAELAEAQARTEQRMGELAEAQAALTTRFVEHERRNALDFQVLKDEQLLKKLAELPVMFSSLVDDPEPLSRSEAGAWLASLLSQRRLAASEVRELAWADLLVRGRREEKQGYLVVETSWTIGLRDVERAVRRAGLLQEHAEVATWPVVVGYRVAREAKRRLDRGEALSLVLPER